MDLEGFREHKLGPFCSFNIHTIPERMMELIVSNTRRKLRTDYQWKKKLSWLAATFLCLFLWLFQSKIETARKSFLFFSRSVALLNINQIEYTLFFKEQIFIFQSSSIHFSWDKLFEHKGFQLEMNNFIYILKSYFIQLETPYNTPSPITP